MSYASRKPQSRAETEANARTLRNLVKQPDNKTCADCKRNDTRWASWNLGCFLCIRCSGIHRSMGTHISRVKSIDLDIWTPEQMDSIKKWGNKRANAYWEAHLKPGHVPPDHKIESFIRSKYESRRWALDGPPPSDPSVLDHSQGASAPSSAAHAASAPATSKSQGIAPSMEENKRTKIAPSNPLLDLLDGDVSTPVASSKPPVLQTSTTAARSAKSSTTSGGGLFDLDWDDSASKSSASMPFAASQRASTRGKDEILSLFSTASAPKPASTQESIFSSSQGPSTSLSSQLGAMNLNTASSAAVSSSSVPPVSGDLFNTQDIWGTPAPTKPAASNKDAFADIWGDFK